MPYPGFVYFHYDFHHFDIKFNTNRRRKNSCQKLETVTRNWFIRLNQIKFKHGLMFRRFCDGILRFKVRWSFKNLSALFWRRLVWRIKWWTCFRRLLSEIENFLWKYERNFAYHSTKRRDFLIKRKQLLQRLEKNLFCLLWWFSVSGYKKLTDLI